MKAPAALTAAAAALALLTAGCGGGERQDADEPSGNYTVDVTKASFPASQRLADSTVMRIAVKNVGTEPLPAVAVTVDSFSQRSQQEGLADPERPVWIVDEGPVGGVTAFTNTWSLDKLAPGQTKTFVWKLTAVVPGRHQVKYTVAAGLDGKAKARDADGTSPVTGTFDVDVSSTPAQSRVDPKTGKVVSEDSAEQ